MTVEQWDGLTKEAKIELLYQWRGKVKDIFTACHSDTELSKEVQDILQVVSPIWKQRGPELEGLINEVQQPHEQGD